MIMNTLGTFGAVWKVKRISDGKIFVWKELDYGNMKDKEKKQLVAEVNILRELKHPNIVRYHDRIIDKKNTKIYIIMEYWEGGDISELIKKWVTSREHIPEDQIWKIFTQIVLALHECHGRKEGKILHRDIKPGNLFLDVKNNVKLGDFGLARLMGKESIYAYTNVGTPYYMSPEQINEQKYNEKSDIWSTGWIVYEMAKLRPPFEAKSQVSLALKIKEGKFDRIPKIYSEELWRVITLMLSPDKEKRPAVEDLLNIPQVSLRLREKRLKESFEKLKRREQDIKSRELKFVQLESKLLKQEEEMKKQQSELEDKDKMLKEKEDRINELEKKLNEMSKSTPPLIMAETPKPHWERGSSLRDLNRFNGDGSTVYHSLKQEIRELSNQVSYDASTHLRLKKQVSHIPSKREELLREWRSENEHKNLSHNTFFTNPKKTYEYKKDSYTQFKASEFKENVRFNANWRDSLENPCEQYTTPPFKSYKAKVPEKERVLTTSYRSRSKAYNDSTRSSVHTKNSREEDDKRLLLRRDRSQR
jgi:NIMA (never in mitosis gene a)-related kinase 2